MDSHSPSRSDYGIIAIAMIPPGAKRSGMDSHSPSRSDYGIIAIAMIPPGAKRSGMDSHSSSRSDYGIIDKGSTKGAFGARTKSEKKGRRSPCESLL